MNCEYSDVIMLMDSNHQLRDEIKELKKQIELLKTKLKRDDEILNDRTKLKDMFNPNHLWNADRTKYSKYCPNYDSDLDK